MQAWAGYSLSDLLMFSPAAYFRLYELNNAALWPLQLGLAAAAVALLLCTRRNRTAGARCVGVLLAALWAFVAWWFFYRQYAQINLAAPWFSIAFGVQALLMLIAASAGRLRLGAAGWHMKAACIPGLSLFLYALVLHPLMGLLLSGRAWRSMELFGFAPDPTALGTIGILLMGRGVILKLLTAIPLSWCLISALTYWAMEMPHGFVTPAAAVVAMAAAALIRAPSCG